MASGFDDSNDINYLLDQVDALKRRVNELEAALRELRQQLPSFPPTDPELGL